MNELAINGGNPVFEKPISYAHQYIDNADIQAVVDVLKSDYLTTGPKIDEVEEKLSIITGAKHVVMIANGTAALHATIFAAGVGYGDEVITTPITFAALAILRNGTTDRKQIFINVTYREDAKNIGPINLDLSAKLVFSK